MNDSTRHSEILEDILLFIYPLIILFGIFVEGRGCHQKSKLVATHHTAMRQKFNHMLGML